MLPNDTIGLTLPVTDDGDQSYRGPKSPVAFVAAKDGHKKNWTARGSPVSIIQF
jgi:hypothetical protein